jgi:3-methyl-2-oxobutanoate hydroxymethyltransferase
MTEATCRTSSTLFESDPGKPMTPPEPPPLLVQDLWEMKRRGTKIAAVVAWDYQMARLAERAGADIVSVGDSVGVHLWGRSNPLDVTLEEMLLVCKAVRRGVKRAILSCDFPFGPLQEGEASAVSAAIRLVKEGGADMVKLDDAPNHLKALRAVVDTGVPVFAQFGGSPQGSLRGGLRAAAQAQSSSHAPSDQAEVLVAQAQALEDAGAALLDVSNSGPEVGPKVVTAVSIPVLGGAGGGPWLDGRVRMATAAVGYEVSSIESSQDSYATVAATCLAGLSELVQDIRQGRQIRGQPGRDSDKL